MGVACSFDTGVSLAFPHLNIYNGTTIFMFLVCLQITPRNIDVRVTVKCVHVGPQIVQK